MNTRNPNGTDDEQVDNSWSEWLREVAWDLARAGYYQRNLALGFVLFTAIGLGWCVWRSVKFLGSW